MELDLTTLSRDVLKSIFNSQHNKLIDLQIENNTADQGKIRSLTQYVDKLTKEINSRDKEEEKEEKPEIKKVATKDYMSHKIKNMSHILSSEIPVFSSGHDVHVWLSKLDSYHRLFVKDDTTGIMAEHFLQNAKSRLCPEYLNSMMQSGVATATYDEMKEYMKKHHASKLSVFQILDTIWEMDLTESETLRDFGIRLDDKAAEAKNIITSKFADYAATEESRQNKALSLDDTFKLMAGQVFLQILKSKKQNIYNNVCNDLDKTWSAAEIANKAMTFSDRLIPENSQNQGSAPTAFVAKAEDKNKVSRHSQKNKVCRRFIMGKCKWGKDCFQIHDDALLDLFKSRDNQNSDDSNKKSGNFNKKSGKKSGKKDGKDNDRDSESTKTSAFVATNTIPVVPLPKQDFRY